MLAWPAESLQEQSCHFVISPQVFLLQPRAFLTFSLTYQDITDTKTNSLPSVSHSNIPPLSLNFGHWWWHCTGHSLARALCSVLCLSSLGTNPTLPGAGPNTASHWSAAANTASDWRRKWRYLCVYRNTGPHSALSPLSVATVCAAASRRPFRSPPEGETQICAERKVHHVHSSYGSKFRWEQNSNTPFEGKSGHSWSDVLVCVIKLWQSDM